MKAGASLDVSRILTAAYRRPATSNDVADRVRSRIAFLNTATEFLRLVFQVPVDALTVSLSPGALAPPEIPPNRPTDASKEGSDDAK
jgi:hypothetical protein